MLGQFLVMTLLWSISWRMVFPIWEKIARQHEALFAGLIHVLVFRPPPGSQKPSREQIQPGVVLPRL
jgi:hypothetical protein